MNKEIDETITFIEIFLKNIELEKRIDKAIDLLEESRENIDLPWYDRKHLIERIIRNL